MVVGSDMADEIIAADWGSSRLRLFLLHRDGRVLAKRYADDGVFADNSDPYADRFTSHAADWLSRPSVSSILICGMAGSDRGWIAAPYIPCPATLNGIAGGLVAVSLAGPSGQLLVRIVPGVDIAGGVGQRKGDPGDVMRGEETLILGLIGQGIKQATLCMPGTHSKWVRLAEGTIEAFETFMTGELRQILLTSSSLRPECAQTDDWDAFYAGAERVAQGAPLTHVLFGARAGRLRHTLDARSIASYMSGALIAHEVIHGIGYGRDTDGHLRDCSALHLLAEDAVGEAYQRVFTMLGCSVTVQDAELCVIAGLRAIAAEAGLWDG